MSTAWTFSLEIKRDFLKVHILDCFVNLKNDSRSKVFGITLFSIGATSMILLYHVMNKIVVSCKIIKDLFFSYVTSYFARITNVDNLETYSYMHNIGLSIPKSIHIQNSTPEIELV